MATAMATAVGVGAVRVAVSVAVSPGRSASSVSQLTSSFTGLSVSNWKKIRNEGEMRLYFVPSPATTINTPVGFPVAKMKTHKAAAKRFRVTGSGKIVRRQAGRAHLLRKKTTKRKNRLAGRVQVDRSDYDNVIGALPYLKVSRSV